MSTAITHKSTSTVSPAIVSPLDGRYLLRPLHAGIVALWCAVFLVLSYLPVGWPALWSHVAYGRAMLRGGAVPAEHPLMPLAEGFRVIDSAWLSQAVLALTETLGPEALANLLAVSVLITLLVSSRVYYLQTRAALLAAAGAMFALAIGWSQLILLGPQTFGMLCFVVLLWLVTGSLHGPRAPDSVKPTTNVARNHRWRLWIGVPLVMVLWANLHDSFLLGLVVLACFLIGRVVEVVWYTGRLRAAVLDRQVHVWLGLCELATLATLVNPYGLDLLLNTVGLGRQAALHDTLVWQPLALLEAGGPAFALSWVALLVALRYSRRRVPVAHVLMLAAFSVAVACNAGLIGWYAFLFVMVLMPHVADIATRKIGRRATVVSRTHQPTDRRAWRPALVALLVVWTTFALSGLSRPLLGGTMRRAESVFGSATPLGLTVYLNEEPPQGQVFHPRWWGDWLVTHSAPTWQPFVTSDLELAPPMVQMDYEAIEQVQPGWQRALDRYRVTTLIIDKQRQALLASVVRLEPEWELRYEDDEAIVFTRRVEEEAKTAG